MNFSGLSRPVTERQQILNEMAACIAHRGPDDEQFHDDGVMALGYRRLSIIDLEGGQQPIWNEDGQVLGVVNGEIYNHDEIRKELVKTHTFSSRSDSEVVVHLYEDQEEDLFNELNGMFAVAIWDTARQRLLLARDRLGIKPLYYAIANGTIIFGSELKALLAHPDCPREVNWQEIKSLGGVHYPVTPSYVSGIHHLPAGHTLVFEPGKAPRLSSYWSINEHFSDWRETPQHPPQYYVDRYGELFDDSVKKRLMSDVPLGVFLSGGIDSALVTAVAATQVSGLHCFTVAEQTTTNSGDLEQARNVADQLGCALHAVCFDGDTLLDEIQFDLAYLEHMVWCMDSPRFNADWFFKNELHRYAKTHIPEIKVMLIGQGADEFAGGYSNSYATPRRDWAQYLKQTARPYWLEFSQREDAIMGPQPFDSPYQKARALRSEYQHIMYMNIHSLQYINLWHEDRTSSSHGVEARVPFLDHRLVELLASIPPAYHEDLFWDKQIVREQLRRLLPDYPVDWPKIPFTGVPGNASIHELFKAMLKLTIKDFEDKYLSAGGNIISVQDARRLYQQAISGSPGTNKLASQLIQIMCVAIFEKMCSRKAMGYPPPSIPTASPLSEI